MGFPRPSHDDRGRLGLSVRGRLCRGAARVRIPRGSGECAWCGCPGRRVGFSGRPKTTQGLTQRTGLSRHISNSCPFFHPRVRKSPVFSGCGSSWVIQVEGKMPASASNTCRFRRPKSEEVDLTELGRWARPMTSTRTHRVTLPSRKQSSPDLLRATVLGSSDAECGWNMMEQYMLLMCFPSTTESTDWKTLENWLAK